MSNAETIRAWKDPEYRSTLSVVPTHPAGVIELADADFGRNDAAAARGLKLTKGNYCHPRTNKQTGC